MLIISGFSDTHEFHHLLIFCELNTWIFMSSFLMRINDTLTEWDIPHIKSRVVRLTVVTNPHILITAEL